MRFVWVSNAPYTPSGYGQQTRMVVPRLADLGHDIGIICYHGLESGSLQMTPNVILLPKRFHPYGNDIVVPHAQAFNARMIMSLTDVWVMNVEEYPRAIKWVPYYPVDHDPMPPIVRHKLQFAWRRIAMSKFGVSKSQEAGLNCHYAPHMIETKVLVPKDKKEARARLGLPADAYVVGTVAMNKGNPSRKNFVEHMMAFAAFKKRHTDAVYFLQTDTGQGTNEMVNLPELANQMGLQIGKDVYFCNQYQNVVGFPTDYFADLYSALDVHLLASAGEGFGIPNLEAQSCGTPIITGDWTACGELCFAGVKIDKKDAEPFYTALASFQYKPHVRAVELALEHEYKHPSNGAKAREAVVAEYDCDVVMEKHWKPIMREIEEGIDVE